MYKRQGKKRESQTKPMPLPGAEERYGTPVTLPRRYKQPDQPEAKVANREHKPPHTCHSESDGWPSLSSTPPGSEDDQPIPPHLTKDQILKAQHQCDWGWPNARDRAIAAAGTATRPPAITSGNGKPRDDSASEDSCPPLESDDFSGSEHEPARKREGGGHATEVKGVRGADGSDKERARHRLQQKRNKRRPGP